MKHHVLICALSAAIMTLASGSSWAQEQAVDCTMARDDIAILPNHRSNMEE